ncbi:hypothetical protein [Flexivirga meconopsidis]|uniref:hypothetical protein n=1 Tax=Flexivirga meconopsidis TaxID=2977121 RepID=UPI00223E9DAE|nr:hypothetical protein [Flexivirga meconopsidis]
MTVALIMDIDGVISPVHGQTAWGDDVDAGPAIGQVLVSPALNSRLDSLAKRPGVVARWLTSWDIEMRSGMTFPGKEWKDIDRAHPEPTRPLSDLEIAAAPWWKWTSLARWLDQRPDVSAVVWCDDNLENVYLKREREDGQPGALGYRTAGDIARDELSARQIAALLICPSARVGLTPDDVVAIEQFVEAARDRDASDPVGGA